MSHGKTQGGKYGKLVGVKEKENPLVIPPRTLTKQARIVTERAKGTGKIFKKVGNRWVPAKNPYKVHWREKVKFLTGEDKI